MIAKFYEVLTSPNNYDKILFQVDTCPTAPASASLCASAGGSDGITFSASGFEGKQKNHNVRCQIYEILTKPYKLLNYSNEGFCRGKGRPFDLAVFLHF